MLLRNSKQILSFSPDRHALSRRESLLRSNGLEVISVSSAVQARYEIEMGRCGVLLMCFKTSGETARELTNLFRKYCPDGRIVFVTNQNEPPFFAEVVIPEREELQLLPTALRAAA